MDGTNPNDWRLDGCITDGWMDGRMDGRKPNNIEAYNAYPTETADNGSWVYSPKSAPFLSKTR